jgi:hypothetical protein
MADNSRAGFSSEGGIGTALFWPLVSNIRGDVWFRHGTLVVGRGCFRGG